MSMNEREDDGVLFRAYTVTQVRAAFKAQQKEFERHRKEWETSKRFFEQTLAKAKPGDTILW
jgi:hypothetical protein